MNRFPPGLEPVDDLTPAAWVEEALKDWPSGRSFLVRDLVPPVYEAYARILHRAHRPEDRGNPTGTWAERATQLGRPLGSETSWYDLTGTNLADGPGRDAWVPSEGGLSEQEATTLAALLSGHTTTPLGCWFAMWSGWGEISGGSSPLYPVSGPITELRMRRRTRREGRRARREAARLKAFPLLGGGRSYLLFHGAMEGVARFDLGHGFRSPALWWPEDRALFVHTEIDALSTYVGGSRLLVDSLVGEQFLEAFEVHADTTAAEM
jgi:hypothetical protein